MLMSKEWHLPAVMSIEGTEDIFMWIINRSKSKAAYDPSSPSRYSIEIPTIHRINSYNPSSWN